jgi:lipopolysaccharide heptosyltransferase I
MTDPPHRFLIVRLSSIGDIVHALPAAAALAQTFPAAEIDWVVEKRHALLLAGNPHLRRVMTLDTLGWRKRLASPAAWNEMRRGIESLRETPYEAAIDFQGLWKSAVVAWLSGAKKRIGFASPDLREPSAGVLYSQTTSRPRQVHVVKENLALVESLGAHAQQWQFPLPRNHQDDTYIEIQLAAFNGGPFLIVNPGGGWRTKCWSPENYALLIREWAAAHTERIVVTGAPSEEPVIQEILTSAGTISAHYFPTTLIQFIALARRARLFVGGDTGPLHLAAAMGTPIVGIFGPTDPVRNGPLAPDDITLSNGGPINYTRRNDTADYLAGISVKSVMTAMEARLSRVHG